MARKLVPMFNRILLKKEKLAEKTTGGIILPEAVRDRTTMGEVIDYGPNVDFDSLPGLKVGSKVMFGKYSGGVIKLGDDEYFIINDDDIMGIVQDD